MEAQPNGRRDAQGRRVTVLVSRWNELSTHALLDGALTELNAAGIEDIDIVETPGAWEIPLMAAALLRGERKPDAIVALACILQGQTTHAKLLGADVSRALMDLQVEFGVPIGWGVLTPDTLEQALDRSGGKMGNKGREAALAALEAMGALGRLPR